MMKKAILVAGMHRSGTSALTRVLSLLGADLPQNLLPPVKNNNEKGFWESKDVVDLNDAILAAAGSSWDDWTVFNPDWFASPPAEAFYQQAQQLLSQFDDSPLFIIKDPRICRLMPFWLRALQDYGAVIQIIIPFRHPLEVAQSLKKRNQMPISQGLLLWKRHVLDALHHAKPFSPVFIQFDQLIQDWRGSTARIAQEMGIAWPQNHAEVQLEIDTFIDADDKHQNIQQLPEAYQHHSALNIYDKLWQLQSEPQNGRLWRSLEQSRHHFNQSSQDYALIFAYEKKQRQLEKERLEADIQQLLEQQQQLWNEKQQVDALLAQAQQEREKIWAEKKQLDASLAEVQKEREKIWLEKQQLEQNLSQLKDEKERIWTEKQYLDVLLATAHQQKEQIWQEKQQLQAEKEQLSADLTALKQEKNQLWQEKQKLHQQLMALQAEKEKIWQDKNYWQQRAEEDHQQKKHLEQQIDNLNRSFERDFKALQEEMILQDQEIRAVRDELDFARKFITELAQTLSIDEQQDLSAQIHQKLEEVLQHRLELEQRLIAAEKQKERALQALKQWEGRYHAELGLAEQKLQRAYQLFARISAKDRQVQKYLQPSALKYAAKLLLKRRQLDKDVLIIKTSGLFSPAYYLINNPDVLDAGADPLLHFCQYGWKEGRNPSPQFDIAAYWQKYPELKEYDLNPLVHYIVSQQR